MSNTNFLFIKTQCLVDMNELCETYVKTINHSVGLILSPYQDFVAHCLKLIEWEFFAPVDYSYSIN